MEKYGNVRILPIIHDQRKLAELYSMADLFVICSKRENFPTTCLEAQCCNTPVIGFDTGGTKETSVESADNFVRYGDVNALSKLLYKKVYDKHEDISESAIKKFSKDTMVDNYLELYSSFDRSERILQIDVNCKYSSTGNIVYNLHEGIKKSGRVASICYGRGPRIIEEGIYKFGLDIETIIHAGMARITGYNGYFSLVSTYRLIKYIESFKPDVIHIHELHAYFVNIPILLKYLKKKGVKVVWTFHCEYMYTGKCGYANECTKYTLECDRCPELHSYPKSMFWDRTNEMFHMKKKLLEKMDITVVTPSNWLANRVKESFLKDKDIKVIYNGIDTNVFHYVKTDIREELGIPENSKVIISVAPDIFSDRKGGNTVLDIAKRYVRENMIFVLVGKA